MAEHSFPKIERLTGEKRVDALFQQGASFVCYPFRVLWRTVPMDAVPESDAVVSAPGMRMLVSVSKRKIRRAVARNRVKRLVREAYRVHKQAALNELDSRWQLQVAFVWIPTEELPFSKVQQRMQHALTQIVAASQLTTAPHV